MFRLFAKGSSSSHGDRGDGDRVDESAEIDAGNAYGADAEQAFMTCPCVAVQEARREWHDGNTGVYDVPMLAYSLKPSDTRKVSRHKSSACKYLAS